MDLFGRERGSNPPPTGWRFSGHRGCPTNYRFGSGIAGFMVEHGNPWEQSTPAVHRKPIRTRDLSKEFGGPPGFEPDGGFADFSWMQMLLPRLASFCRETPETEAIPPCSSPFDSRGAGRRGGQSDKTSRRSRHGGEWTSLRR